MSAPVANRIPRPQSISSRKRAAVQRSLKEINTVAPRREPRAFHNDAGEEEEEEENEEEEEDGYSPLTGPSPSPAPPRVGVETTRGNNNRSQNSNNNGNSSSKHQQQQAGMGKKQYVDPETTTTTPATTTPSSFMDEYIFKVCVVGNHNVGKTTLVRRICNPVLTATKEQETQVMMTRPTIGVDFSSRIVENIRPGALVRVQLWDTAGLEKFAAVSAPVYRNCAGVIAVLDVLNKDTLENLAVKWLPAVLEQLPNLPLSSVLVVCNKVDLLENFITKKDNPQQTPPPGVDPAKFTSAAEAAQVLSNYGINDTLIMEVSAKSGLNVEEALSLLCNRIIDKIATTVNEEEEKNDVEAAAAALKISAKKEKQQKTENKKKEEEAKRKKEEELERSTSPTLHNAGVSTVAGSDDGQQPPLAAAVRPKPVNLSSSTKTDDSEPLDTSVGGTRRKREKAASTKYCPC